jgi:hypothetical protein
MKVILACNQYGHKAEYEINANADGGIFPCMSIAGMPWCPSAVAWKGLIEDVKAESRESASQAD